MGFENTNLNNQQMDSSSNSQSRLNRSAATGMTSPATTTTTTTTRTTSGYPTSNSSRLQLRSINGFQPIGIPTTATAAPPPALSKEIIFTNSSSSQLTSNSNRIVSPLRSSVGGSTRKKSPKQVSFSDDNILKNTTQIQSQQQQSVQLNQEQQLQQHNPSYEQQKQFNQPLQQVNASACFGQNSNCNSDTLDPAVKANNHEEIIITVKNKSADSAIAAAPTNAVKTISPIASSAKPNANISDIKRSIKNRLEELEKRIQTSNEAENHQANLVLEELDQRTADSISEIDDLSTLKQSFKATSLNSCSDYGFLQKEMQAGSTGTVPGSGRTIGVGAALGSSAGDAIYIPSDRLSMYSPRESAIGDSSYDYDYDIDGKVHFKSFSFRERQEKATPATSSKHVSPKDDDLLKQYQIDPRTKTRDHQFHQQQQQQQYQPPSLGSAGQYKGFSSRETFGSSSSQQLKLQLEQDMNRSFSKHSELERIKQSIQTELRSSRTSRILAKSKNSSFIQNRSGTSGSGNSYLGQFEQQAQILHQQQQQGLVGQESSEKQKEIGNQEEEEEKGKQLLNSEFQNSNRGEIVEEKKQDQLNNRGDDSECDVVAAAAAMRFIDGLKVNLNQENTHSIRSGRINVRSIKDFQLNSSVGDASDDPLSNTNKSGFLSSTSRSKQFPSKLDKIKQDLAEQAAQDELQRRISSCILTFKQEQLKEKQQSQLTQQQQQQQQSTSQLLLPASGQGQKQKPIDSGYPTLLMSGQVNNTLDLTTATTTLRKGGNINGTIGGSGVNGNAMNSKNRKVAATDGSPKNYQEKVKQMISDKVNGWIQSAKRLEDEKEKRENVKPLLLASSYKKLELAQKQTLKMRR